MASIKVLYCYSDYISHAKYFTIRIIFRKAKCQRNYSASTFKWIISKKKFLKYLDSTPTSPLKITKVTSPVVKLPLTNREVKKVVAKEVALEEAIWNVQSKLHSYINAVNAAWSRIEKKTNISG